VTLSKQIAKNFRDVFFGGNWTAVNLKDSLQNVSWEQAVTKVYDLNTIAMLVFHINYYVEAVLKVLYGEALNASDKFSFDLHPVNSEEEWQKLVAKVMTEAEQFAAEIEKLEDDKFFEDFSNPKYGNNYRNIVGIIEHTHYHLGQIVLIKKILAQQASLWDI
jgi:hypothetical protein